MSNAFLTGGGDYAASRPTYPTALVAAISALAPSHSLAVDAGCGSGQLSVELARHFESVVAVDPSASQLAAAPVRAGVRFCRGHAEQLPVPDGAADMIFAAQAAHWFDLARFYNEANRALAPEGLVALITYGVPEITGPLAGTFRRWYHGDAYDHWPSARQFVESLYADLPFPFDEQAMPTAQIVRQWTVEQLLRYVATWSSTKRAQLQGVDLVSSLRDVLGTGQIEYSATIEIRWPLGGRLGVRHQV